MTHTNRPILVALDGSPSSKQAFKFAVPIVLCRRVPLILIHLLESNAPPRVHGEPHLAGHASAAQNDLERIASSLDIPCITVCEPCGKRSLPVALTEEAAKREASLLVMAIHGAETTFPRWFRGSVVHRSVSVSPCPIFLPRGMPVFEPNGRFEGAFLADDSLRNTKQDGRSPLYFASTNSPLRNSCGHRTYGRSQSVRPGPLPAGDLS